MVHHPENSGGYPTLVGVLDPTILDGYATSDAILLSELYGLVSDNPLIAVPSLEVEFANEALIEFANPHRTLEERERLEAHLASRDTTHIPIDRRHRIVIDGEERHLALVSATDTDSNHGDMSEKFYLRDQVQAAASLMELYIADRERYHEEGALARELIASSLDFMSTPNQEQRFADVTVNGGGSQEAWPHILSTYDDLETAGANHWRNIQDSFQMLAHLTFDALDRDVITTDFLTAAHKRFLGSVMPLLAAVGYPKYETSGSWEEAPAFKTSAMAVDTAMLHKLQLLRAKGLDLDFLEQGYLASQAHVSQFTGVDFDTAVAAMVDRGLVVIGQRIPYESPDEEYEGDPVRYREHDMAALSYILQYDIPKLLAECHISIGKEGAILSFEAIETLVLEEVDYLIDPNTKGMKRYQEDDYQGLDWHTRTMQVAIEGVKRLIFREALARQIEPNYHRKQQLRGEKVPKGAPAIWNLGLEHVASWLAKESVVMLDAGDAESAEWYDLLASYFVNYSLSHVTGENQWHLVQDDQKQYQIQKVPPDRVPECLVTYKYFDGEGREITFMVPSPHVPLNWGVAKLKQAVGLQTIYARKKAALRKNQTTTSAN